MGIFILLLYWLSFCIGSRAGEVIAAEYDFSETEESVLCVTMGALMYTLTALIMLGVVEGWFI